MHHEPGTPDIAEDWYASAFDVLYPVVYAHRSVASAELESRFAAEVTRLQPGDHVLDLCCGNGRHMVHLLEQSSHVTGLDFSEYLLREARENTGGRGQLVHGDMRALPFSPAFDVVANFFTSFGYFLLAEENDAVLRELAGALKPGGRFFMDYLNPSHLEANLVPRSHRTHNGYEIIEERWIDPKTRRVNKNTKVLRGGQVMTRTGESVQLYTRAELEDMLQAQGLHPEAVFGDYDGSSVGDKHPRMIFAGTKRG